MRGKKAKQLRALTREHTPGLPLRALHPVTTHLVRGPWGPVNKATGLPVLVERPVVNPIRMINDCTRRQYQVNKAFYKRLRRGDEVIYG